MLSSLNERFEIFRNSSKYVSFKRSHCAFCLIVPKIKIILRCIHNNYLIGWDKMRIFFMSEDIYLWTLTFKNARVSLTSWTSSTRDSVLNIPRGRKETIQVPVGIIAYHNFFSTIDSTSSWSFYDLYTICLFYVVLTYTRARTYLKHHKSRRNFLEEKTRGIDTDWNTVVDHDGTVEIYTCGYY